MKICDLLETPSEVKLLIKLTSGDSVYKLRNNSASVKLKFKQIQDTPHNRATMREFLFNINMLILKIAELPQWDSWMLDNSGKAVMRELTKIYNDNLAFMKRFQ